MRLVLTFVGVLGMGMALTTAFAGTRGPVKPAAAAHRAKPGGRLTQQPALRNIGTNPALAARLQPLVPAGMTLTNAAAGFASENQFIAALHVSRNLKIPFAQLKAEATGADRNVLIRAVHDLRPNADEKAAVRAAEQQTRRDIRATNRSARPEIDKTEN